MKQTGDTDTNQQVAQDGTKKTTLSSSSSRNSTQSSEPRRVKALQPITLALIAAVIGFGGGWLGGKQATDPDDAGSSTQRVVLDQQGELISDIAKEVGESVVSVNVISQTNTGGFGFFGFGGGNAQQRSAGTGVIIDSDGLIITNRHVVPEGTTSVSVVLADGTELKDVEVVGRTNEDDPLDVAFLQVKDKDGAKLVAAKLGKSNEMQVGESVVAIGNALGQFQNSVTTGIISGYGRNVQASDGSGFSTESLNDLFQTDAAINQGNSGGPLVNLNGEVIGINTAVADQAENIGFAIPIDNIRGLIDRVSKTGKLERPYLGVVYVPLTDALAKEYDLSVARGAYVPRAEDFGQDTVVDGGPAEKAGIKEGDVITKIENESLDEDTSLPSLLGRFAPGDEVELTVHRDGKNETIKATLGVMPASNG